MSDLTVSILFGLSMSAAAVIGLMWGENMGPPDDGSSAMARWLEWRHSALDKPSLNPQDGQHE